MIFLSDEEVFSAFKKHWGLSCSIDLYECSPELIRSAEAIKQYAAELCDFIEMKRFGEPVVVDFGEDPRVSGYSLMQLIETSSITGHFANQTNTAYIDVFSCKYYPPYKTMEFCKKYFKAKKAVINIALRE